ncbi:MAG TPA: type II toxin-antitoxin system PemK/MazF family toxin [Planctomycetota bacterium]|nr:type II toxin-antitoxin system PemK/MazF family toxin [Planctomycetota bacterium]
MARILRGEIRWADLGRARGRGQKAARPVLVISHDVFNERSGTVIVMALTTRAQRAGFPLTLELRAKGPSKRSWLKISQVRTLSVERIGGRFGRASPEDMASAVDGLMEIVGA